MNIYIAGMNIHIPGIENEVCLIKSDGAGQHVGTPMVSTERGGIWDASERVVYAQGQGSVATAVCGWPSSRSDRPQLLDRSSDRSSVFEKSRGSGTELAAAGTIR